MTQNDLRGRDEFEMNLTVYKSRKGILYEFSIILSLVYYIEGKLSNHDAFDSATNLIR